MNRFDTATLTTVRATGGFQVLLGLLLWAGVGLRWIPLHMFIGIVFVLALLTLAVRGLRLAASRGLGAFTVAWGILVVAFGMSQAQIMPGENHWIIRTLHLIVGLGAMGLAGALAASMARAGRPGADRGVVGEAVPVRIDGGATDRSGR